MTYQATWWRSSRVVLWQILLIVGFLTSCSSSRRIERTENDTEEPASTSSEAVWEMVRSLAARDARLLSSLERRSAGEGWELDASAPSLSSSHGDFVTSPGWRAVKDKRWSELGARLSLRADEPWELGISQFHALLLRLTLRGAAPAQGEVRDGHLLYRAAFGRGVDVVVSTSRVGVEQLFFIHDRDAVARASESSGRAVDDSRHVSFSWDVELPSGIHRAALALDGSLAFKDARGDDVLRIAPPYAVDAEGTRRDAHLSWEQGTRRLGLELDTQGLSFPILLDPAFETVSWRKIQAPPNRHRSATAYDAQRGRVVVFGGLGINPSTRLNDTWTWDGLTWTQETPISSPPARSDHTMAYDAKRKCVVLFGGVSAAGVRVNDTWTWDGSAWLQMTPGAFPSVRTTPAMAYDAKRERVVLFGGQGFGSVNLSDTWTWDGANWSLMSPATQPSARASHAMAYDATHERVVLFGGWGGSALNDTWTWDGLTWTQEPPVSSPPVRNDHAMAYDAKRKRVVLFGGVSAAGGRMNDTWTWDGSAWTQEEPASSPNARSALVMAYDSQRERLILFGGYSANDDTTWTWDGSTWEQLLVMTPPSGRTFHAMANDAKHERVVLFGGATTSGKMNDTWTWDGANWKQVTAATSPTARAMHAMVYDAKRGQVVLFGGSSSVGLNDTWTWNGANWNQVIPASSPNWRERHAMAYDAKRERVVVFGGWGGSALNDTWEWDGTSWEQKAPASSPGGRNNHSMAYDAKRERVVLFGGRNGSTFLNDTWEWDGSSWEQKLPKASPTIRVDFPMTYDAQLERVILFGGNNGELVGDTWSWDGVSWSQIAPAPARAPSARASQAMAYDERLKRTVMFGGDDGNATRPNDTWIFMSRGGACMSAADCATGFCLDGVCCEASVCGECQACDGATPGRCSPVLGAPDPDSCTGSRACSADGVCMPAPGQACSRASDCASGFCVDGVCCDSACTGTCQACTASLKESGPDGICGPAKKGLDPREDCPNDGDLSCQRTGECDGKGYCALYAAGTRCSSSLCSDGHVTARRCDGFGVCLSAATLSCTPYVCAGEDCGTSCTSSADCATNFTCDPSNRACVPQAAASCDGDHTLIAPDRTTTDCTPYKCAGATCKTSCTSVLDCAFPSECSGDTHTCVPTDARNGSSDAAGCAVRAPRSTPSLLSVLAASFALIGATLVRRQRPRRARGLTTIVGIRRLFKSVSRLG